MIGNDIVDLTVASSGNNWNTQRFLDKIFTPEEKKYINSSTDPLQTIWLLWSMKESAYKVHIQRFQKPFFAPIKIACQLHSKSEGLVMIDHAMYKTTSQITTDYIYTIAVFGTAKCIIDGCAKLSQANTILLHHESYRSVLRAFATHMGFQEQGLEIRKNAAGVPKLFRHHKEQSVSISITHHGDYYAYALSA